MKKAIIAITTIGILALMGMGYHEYQNRLPNQDENVKMLRAIYDNALLHSDSHENLRYLCKRIGGRLAGSPQAAAAVEWGKQTLQRLEVDSVFLQPCMVPHWERGEKEQARIISKLIGWEEVQICALGNSIPTPEIGLTAPVVEAKSVEAIADMDVKGKIVFVNNPFDHKHMDTFDAYSGCVGDRYEGAPMAAKHGAVGFILRSLGHAIDDFPHTGNMAYEEGIPPIPSVAISTKGAEYLSKIIANDDEASFYMKLNCKSFPDKPSYNVIADIKGSEFPDEIIMVSGHLDAWDNGEGAHDDGSGVVQSMDVLRLFKDLNYKPKRTIRCVLWMNEENGTRGAREYLKVAKETKENCILAIESDRGGFAPRGFFIDADSSILKNRFSKIESFRKVLEPYQLHIFEEGFSGVDIKFLKEIGTTCVGLVPDSQRYFDYHHTANDVFENVNKRELELGVAGMASLVYLVDQYGIELAEGKK